MEERTEEATPQKVREARQKGQVARSQDLVGALSLAAAWAVLAATLPGTAGLLLDSMRASLEQVGRALDADPGRTALQLALLQSRILGPVLGASFLTALVCHLVLTGATFAPSGLSPQPQRLDPLEAAKRWFSRRTAIELLKLGTKVACLGGLCYDFLARELVGVLVHPIRSVGHARGFLDLVGGFVWRLLLAQVVLGVFDALYQNWEYRRSLRMTSHEVREEHRRSEGDPHVKARRRGRQRKLARARRLTEVRQATVVVTNPTHLAVALRYRRGMSAPRVVARGAELAARKIRELALAHAVPVVENPPLARALFPLEVGREIPPELFQAVAEILLAVTRAEDYL